MDNFIFGKCLNGGSCNTHCQKFTSESDSRNCVDCGHIDSHHALLACKVICEGYQYVPKPVVDVPAAELNERKSQFGRGKVTSSTTTSVTRTWCTGTSVRTVRIEGDPIHTIASHDICCAYL